VNALVKYVRSGELTPGEAGAMLGYIGALPLDSTRCADLADDALRIAIGRGVSGYDAMYLALAEATDSPVVTADRRLAAAAIRSELLTD
jgi:predicted nucleic acid-binding protein